MGGDRREGAGGMGRFLEWGREGREGNAGRALGQKKTLAGRCCQGPSVKGPSRSITAKL